MQCCACEEDEYNEGCRCLCHVTSPQILLTAGEWVEDASLEVWHNATWHLYRQPHGGICLVHMPSTMGQLSYAPDDFIVALLGDEQGVGHTSTYCKDCLEPFLDEHPTLGEWYRRLESAEARKSLT